MDLYRAPTLILLFVLVAVFGGLWLQRRSLPPLRMRAGEAPTARRRQLLWLVGWMFAAIQLEMEVFGREQTGVWLAVSRICMQMAAIMFLGSMASQHFSRRLRIPYVVGVAAPLMVFTIVASIDAAPGPGARSFLLFCILATLLTGARWCLEKPILPIWLGLSMVAAIGGVAVWLTLRHDYGSVVSLAQSGILLITALLFAFGFRRLSAGVVFTVGGLTGWSLPILIASMTGEAGAPVMLMRALNLMKVIAAVGMIVLVLEDEIASNKAAQLRDRRARLEMEKYTEIFLEAMPLEDSSTQYDHICEIIDGASRFSRCAIAVRGPEGRFRIAGSAGLDGALTAALDAMARRTAEDKVRELGETLFTRVIGHVVLLDLEPFMEPGDELQQMNFCQSHAIAIRGREQELLGALLLSGLREPDEPLLTEDVLPLELLVVRIGTAREHQLLLRRLLQAERIAGLGQLAGGVAHELNNPLTVVTGYAELMSDSEGATREHALVILNEARRMKQIIESLIRFRKATPGNRVPVSIEMLLRDIDKLARHDIESAHIDLRMRIPPNLPHVKADGDQIRQVFLQIVKNAVGSMHDTPEGDRRLIIEALPAGPNVQITFSDSGPGFTDPSRAFDPFYTTRHQGEGMGLGLSICYSIIREHGGQLSAVNLLPRGAAVVVELSVAQLEPPVVPEPDISATPPLADAVPGKLQ
ncbi:MAG TPA: ATP-binding protein [Acidobacteriaceae bacterium]|jgi:signal transduction histidine kinase|nr:ATP-binding protein [Acidobacteriaceae bacterium]